MHMVQHLSLAIGCCWQMSGRPDSTFLRRPAAIAINVSVIH